MRVCRCAESHEPSLVVYEVKENLMGLYVFFFLKSFSFVFCCFCNKKTVKKDSNDMLYVTCIFSVIIKACRVLIC